MLEFAAQILSASEDTLYEPKVEYRRGCVPYCELPVDEVIEHYPWVAYREMDWEDDFRFHVRKQDLREQYLACN